MRPRSFISLLLLVAILSVACTGPANLEKEPERVDTTPNLSASPSATSSASPSTVTCRGLQAPTDGEVNTYLDRANGLLEFSYYVARLQRDRSVTIRYRDDLSCRRNPDTWRLILHVLEADESLCLDQSARPPRGMTRVELWFGDRETFSLEPTLVVHRDIPSSPSIAADTLRAWIEGPTKQEMRAGAYASAPDGTELLGIEVDDRTATIDFSEDFERTNLGTTGEGAILNHLAGMLTQFDTIDRGLLKIEGRTQESYMGHGFIVNEENPLTRPGKKSYRVAPTC